METPAVPPPGCVRRRKRRSSGSALVEYALTFVPLWALIFAFVDLGLMLFRWSTLENAVREGCRYAITFQTADGLGQDASIAQVVERYAMGVVKVSDSPQHIYVRYYSPANPTVPITAGGNLPGNIVQVSVEQVSWAWIAPLSGTIGGIYATAPFTLSVYSSDILGGYPAGVNNVPR
jgi:Flp pilus assembly protein TadG